MITSNRMNGPKILHSSLQKRSRLRRTLTVLTIVIGVALLWSITEARLVFLDRVTFSSPEVPQELDGTRILFVSDIHAGDLLGEHQFESTMGMIRAAKADIVILGGDFGGGGRRGYDWFYPEAHKLQAPLGVYAVFGNHEASEPRAVTRRGLRRAGITLLENDNVRVGGGGVGIRIAGVDDYLTGTPDAEAAADGISAKEFAILASHNPDVFPDGLRATQGAFDLALSGHTHGGQITLFGLYAPIVSSRYGQRFRGGWSKVSGVPVLVSRGAGVYILPMRFFAPAQMHEITLKRGPAKITR